jgi:hypothetical protein
MNKNQRSSLNSNGTIENRGSEAKIPQGSNLKSDIHPYPQIARQISPGLNSDEKSIQTKPQTNLAAIYPGIPINQISNPSTGVADL